jgi:hypothetical protein
LLFAIVKFDLVSFSRALSMMWASNATELHVWSSGYPPWWSALGGGKSGEGSLNKLGSAPFSCRSGESPSLSCCLGDRNGKYCGDSLQMCLGSGAPWGFPEAALLIRSTSSVALRWPPSSCRCVFWLIGRALRALASSIVVLWRQCFFNLQAN